MSGIVFGAITGFTLLDDQDDGVLFSLKVTPINVNVYIFLKLLMSYIFSVIATIILVIATGLLDMLPLIDIFFITLLSSFQGPFIALVMNAFSSNKVEGFVIMKLTGLTIIGPILALFLTDWTELLIGIFPGFWTARIMSISMLPIDFFLGPSWIYFSLGLIINVISIYRKEQHMEFLSIFLMIYGVLVLYLTLSKANILFRNPKIKVFQKLLREKGTYIFLLVFGLAALGVGIYLQL